MSLIDQALQRVKEPGSPQPPQPAGKETKTAAPSPAPAPRTIPEPQPVHSWQPAARPTSIAQVAPSNSTLLMVALVVLLMAIGLVVGGLIWFGRAIAAQRSAAFLAPPVAAVQVQPQPTQTQTVTEPRPPPAPAATKRLLPRGRQARKPILSGIVRGLGEPYAVVNATIVRVGDSIDEGTVVAIAEDSVTLQDEDGAEIVVRIKP